MQIVQVVSLNIAPTFIRSLYHWNLHFPLVPGLPTTPLYTSLLTPHLLLSDVLAFSLAFRGKLLITKSSTLLPGSEHQVCMCEVNLTVWKAVLISKSSNFQVSQAWSSIRFLKALFTPNKLRVPSNESFHGLQASYAFVRMLDTWAFNLRASTINPELKFRDWNCNLLGDLTTLYPKFETSNWWELEEHDQSSSSQYFDQMWSGYSQPKTWIRECNDFLISGRQKTRAWIHDISMEPPWDSLGFWLIICPRFSTQDYGAINML